MKKHKLALFSLSALLALTPFVTQAGCTVNGTQVACGYFAPFFATLAIPLIFLGIVSLAFWIWMIIDVIRRQVEHKPLWVLVIIFGQLLGAIIYFFAIRDDVKHRPLAIVAIILAVLSLIPVAGILFAIGAVILGVISKKREAKHDEKSKGISTTGIVVGIIGLIYNAVFIFSALMLLVSGASAVANSVGTVHFDGSRGSDYRGRYDINVTPRNMMYRIETSTTTLDGVPQPI